MPCGQASTCRPSVSHADQPVRWIDGNLLRTVAYRHRSLIAEIISPTQVGEATRYPPIYQMLSRQPSQQFGGRDLGRYFGHQTHRQTPTHLVDYRVAYLRPSPSRTTCNDPDRGFMANKKREMSTNNKLWKINQSSTFMHCSDYYS